MLSPVHEGKMIDTGKRDHKTDNVIKTPDMNIEYTHNMRMVDDADMMIGNTETVRKSFIWCKKLFFFT